MSTILRPPKAPLKPIAMYKLNMYANTPFPIDTVGVAKCGWANDGKDGFALRICKVSWVLAGREGIHLDARMSRNNRVKA